MKACLYLENSRNNWCEKFFPDKAVGELPIAGQSFCRHVVGLCSYLGASDIYITGAFREEQASRLGDGQLWSLSLHYLPTIPCANCRDLLELHRDDIPTTEDLLIVWGLVLPDVSEAADLLKNLEAVPEIPEILPDGIYLLKSGTLYRCAAPCFVLDSVKSYFELNFRLLANSGIYNLPGYSGETGCNIGMDVVILLDCDLQPPLLIRDNVRLERGVRTHDGVIIGEAVLVDEHAELEHSIVFDRTYIGKHTYFRNKIVDRNRVIDVESESVVELEDHFLTGSTGRKGSIGYHLAEWLVALELGVTLLPGYLAALLLRPVLAKLAFFRFLLRIYGPCLRVLCLRSNLVKCGWDDHNYAFRYADMWPLHTDEHRRSLDDVYFYYHRTVGNMLRVVYISLLKRFFMLTPPEAETAPEKGGN